MKKFFYDSRDMIKIMSMYLGEDKKTHTPGMLYHVEKRYPISSNQFEYHDNTPVTDILLEKTIIDSYGVEISHKDISNGKISLTQTKPDYHSETLEMILYSIMYSKSINKDIFYADPVFKSTVPLIPYVFDNPELDYNLYSLLSKRYSDITREGLDMVIDSVYEHLNSSVLDMLDNNILYRIDTNYDIYVLTPLGTPMDHRYYLEYIKNQTK